MGEGDSADEVRAAAAARSDAAVEGEADLTSGERPAAGAEAIEAAESAAEPKVAGFLYEPVASAADLPVIVSDPTDGSAPRVRTPEVELLPSGAVRKQLMVVGRGGDTPTAGHKCFVHLRAWQKDNQSEVMEDSRLEKEPKQIIVGKTVLEHPHLAGVDVALQSMRPGERCVVHVHWQKAYGEKGNFSFPHIPPRTDMVYDLELLGVVAEEEEPPRAEMTFEERCRQGEKRRLMGNELFKAGDLDGAMALYTIALSYFGESFMFQLEGLDKYKKIANDTRLPIHLNLAACKLKKGLPHEAAALCSEVLAAEPDNVKALYRRGCARRALGQDDDALADLARAQELEPKDAGIRAELRKLKAMQKEHSTTAKDMYGGLFGEAPPPPPPPRASWTGMLGGAVKGLVGGLWARRDPPPE